MPATLVATPDLANVPPRVRLDITLPAGAGGVSAYVTRVGSDGRTVPVRLADPAVITGSVWVGYDYEAPFGALQSYSASVVYYVGRANAIINPNFETNALGWTPGYYSSINRSLLQQWSGVASLALDTSYPSGVTHTASVSSAPSTPVTASAYVRGTGTASVYLDFLAVSGTTSVNSSTVTLTGSWQRISVTGTTPADILSTKVRIGQGSSSAQTMYIDGVLAEESSSLGAYFDGATTDTGSLIYDWAGTPDGSTSTERAFGSGATTDTPTATATVAVSDVWLIHPGVPDLSMLLDDVKSPDDMTRSVDRGIFTPYGREMPIIVTDGKRKAVQSQLVFRVRTLEQIAAFNALTSDAATLLLNVPESLGWGQGADYISLGDLVESREVPEDGSDPWRNLGGPYMVTSRPIGGSQSQRTYADLLAECATYQAVMDLYDSYLDVLAPTV